MHGLIFMTWEKYLGERFGGPFLATYREALGETAANLPLANRLYDDDVLLAGVGEAQRLSQVPVETLLREYGRYFIINGLTGHLCAYILTNVHSGRDLLLTMRDAHARLRRTLDGLVPPLFEYERPSPPNEVRLVYDSPRQLCPVLLGAIEGAAERYGETVEIQETSCMKHGAAACRIVARFSAPASDPARYHNSAHEHRKEEQTALMKQIWTLLPEAGTIEGFTLRDIQERLKRFHAVDSSLLRPAVLVEALYQLQFAGYAMSTAAKPGDTMMQRRYWRVHRHM